MQFKDTSRNVVHVSWGDHRPGCEKCREVVVEESRTFVYAFALGSRLLMEELTKRQAPEVAKKAKEVREWAKRAGVFKGAEK